MLGFTPSLIPRHFPSIAQTTSVYVPSEASCKYFAGSGDETKVVVRQGLREKKKNSKKKFRKEICRSLCHSFSFENMRFTVKVYIIHY